ncbi:MAG: NAD-dependent epimerase/dehydratase family protein [Candidatus Limnocylindrales bacterium]
MRIAITGGTGFVGSHLAQRLRAGGHEAVLISCRTGHDLAPAAVPSPESGGFGLTDLRCAS